MRKSKSFFDLAISRRGKNIPGSLPDAMRKDPTVLHMNPKPKKKRRRKRK